MTKGTQHIKSLCCTGQDREGKLENKQKTSIPVIVVLRKKGTRPRLQNKTPNLVRCLEKKYWLKKLNVISKAGTDKGKYEIHFVSQ